jgi:hypothetical protein
MNSCAKLLPVLLAFIIFSSVFSYARALDTIISEKDQIFSEVQYAPAYPYILSYAKITGNKRTIHVFNQEKNFDQELSLPVVSPVGSLSRFFGGPFDSGHADLEFFSGELNWRPVLDARGRQWFVYVSSTSAGELILNFDYISRDGLPSAQGPVQFNFQGEIRTPRWSPDGRMVVFSSRNQLFLLPDISQVINSGSIRGVSPIRLTQTGESNLYPDWSSSGRHIAYQSVSVESGVRNTGISIVMIDPLNPSRVSIPVRVTSHLYNFHEYKPAWSPDANYIAYYISRDPLYTAQTSEELDIGITQLFTNPGTGEIIGGRTGQATAQRVARNAHPRDHRGPEWIYLDEGNAASLSLVYVADTGDGIHRIRYTRISEYLLTGNGTNYSLDEISTLPRNVIVTSFTSVPIERSLRVTQIVQDNRSERFHYFERSANYSSQFIQQERNQMQAVWRSALIPGFGQYYKGQNAKGALFFGASAIIAGTNLYLFFIERPSLKDERNDIASSLSGFPAGSPDRIRLQQQLDDKNQSIKNNKNTILGASALFAGLWALNVIDSSLGFPVSISREVKSGTVTGEFGPRFTHGTGEIGFSLRYDF